MINKLISSVILTTTIAFFALSLGSPNNLLFLFASANLGVAAARVILALGMCFLSFKTLLSNRRARQVVKAIGLGLMVFGSLALVMTSLNSAVYDYLKFFDLMILAEAGVVLTSCAISSSATNTSQKAALNSLVRLSRRAA